MFGMIRSNLVIYIIFRWHYIHDGQHGAIPSAADHHIACVPRPVTMQELWHVLFS